MRCPAENGPKPPGGNAPLAAIQAHLERAAAFGIGESAIKRPIPGAKEPRQLRADNGLTAFKPGKTKAVDSFGRQAADAKTKSYPEQGVCSRPRSMERQSFH
jgi:hypothetical protein